MAATSLQTRAYRGRFAPSPTGRLHLGSLFGAVVSYADARHHKGEWQVRIEDIDPPREQRGAADAILQCLEAHALHWDALSYQSRHGERYAAALATLHQQQCVYACPCSRRELNQAAGRHRDDCPSQWDQQRDCAVRLYCRNQHFDWHDGFMGPQSAPAEQDFVVRRRDGLWAYQLAVVADDTAQGITHVVRGADLFDSTPMQLALYAALNKDAPAFAHFPVLHQHAQKLSKQNHAPAIRADTPSANLHEVIALLGLPNPPGNNARPAALLDYIVAHWQEVNFNQARHIDLDATDSALQPGC